MRPIHWLFVISVMLFISGIALVIAAERTTRSASPPASAAIRAAAPVATVEQLMNGVIQPAAAFVWSSVGTTITAAGTDERMPRTDAEWAQVAMNAAIIVESANLLV